MPTSLTKSETGKIGENAVSEYLVNKGCRIITRNYRIKGGEIDIIASKDGYIIFVEVKTRKPNSLCGAFEAVTQKKRNLIIKTAIRYMYENPTNLQPRFDIAAVTALNGRIIDIDYLENAFYAVDYNF